MPGTRRRRNRTRRNQNRPGMNVPIRTVHFSPYDHPMSHYSVYKYFRQFGDVEAVKFHDIQDLFSKKPMYGFVQFKEASAAEAALSHPDHQFDGIKVTVKAADRKYQPPLPSTLFALQQPIGYDSPEPDSPSNILNALDVDCLRKIFGYLLANDLCNVANVCTRFNSIAKQVFAIEFKELDFDEIIVKDNLTFCELESILRTFSKEITFVHVQDPYKESIVFLSMLNEHCSNIKEIVLGGMDLNKRELDVLRPLLPKLDMLEMYENMCWPLGASADLFIEAASNVKILSYREEFPSHFQFSEKIFPNLRELELNGVGHVTTSSLNRFFDLNPTLESVKILTAAKIETSTLLRTISRSLTNLKKLEFGTHPPTSLYMRDILLLAKMPSLTKLDLSYCYLSIAPLIQALGEHKTPIESLKIVEGFIDNAGVKNLSKLVGVNKLNFIRCRNLNDEHLVELAKNLPNLSTLSILNSKQITTTAIKKIVKYSTKLSFIFLQDVPNVTIGSNVYKEILEAVQNKTKLVIQFHGKGGQLKVAGGVHSDWLTIYENDNFLQRTEFIFRD